MSRNLINPFIDEKSIEEVKEHISTLIDKEIVIYDKRIHHNDRVYVNPTKFKVIKKYPHFFMCENRNGNRVDFTYVDVYCQDILIKEF